jgi:glycosyltransferase involved in cell wall biosynthesis
MQPDDRDGSAVMRDHLAPIRVLYLTPPEPRGAALAAQSFIDEEIRAIREWTVTPFVLSNAIAGRMTCDGINVVNVPRERSSAAFLRSAAFALRRCRGTYKVFTSASSPKEVAHAIRIEEAAARLIREEKIDVVHSHFGWPGGFGGSLAAQATGVPLVASIRGMDVLVRPELKYGLRLDAAYDAALRHLLETASRVLTATAFMRDTTVALSADPGNIQILQKGVDTSRFVPPQDRGDAKALLGLSGAVVLAVGALKRRKGFDTVIDGVAHLGRSDVTLVICGEGEERTALARRTESAGLSSQVRFEGHVSRGRISEYFAAADVFVHAAELEAAGNVVLEALAAGCAVVVTDSGGPSEYVEDGCNGFVIPVGDARALASRLEALLGSEPLRAGLAREGRRRVEQRHAYARMMADLRQIYDEVRFRMVSTP